jgi:hypothetical protein
MGSDDPRHVLALTKKDAVEKAASQVRSFLVLRGSLAVVISNADAVRASDDRYPLRDLEGEFG